MKIGIIAAMASEQKLLAKGMTNRTERHEGLYTYTTGDLGHNSIALMQCGIGKVNAAVGTSEIIRIFQPDCIISTGVAGGIDSCLNVMDVVVGESIVYHDVWCGEGNAYGQVQGMPQFFHGNPTLFDCAMSIDTETAIHGGLICTGDKFITSRKELDAIKKEFPDGLAVDMESAAIAQVCHLLRTPFLSFRIISDTPGVENHFSQYLNFWGEMAERSFAVTQAFLKSLPYEL